MSTTAPSSPAEPRRAPARRGQGAALRAEILAAATRMVARSGDAATLTLRAVAREVGVAATSIYLHFDSVEALLVALKAARYAELAATLTAASEAAGTDPVGRLRARAHAYLRYGVDHPGEYAVMFAARLVTANGVPARPRYADQVFDEMGVELRAIRRAGPPMDDQEARLICFHIWTALHGMVSLRLLRPGMDWPDVALEVDDLVDRLVGPVVSAGPARTGPPRTTATAAAPRAAG